MSHQPKHPTGGRGVAMAGATHHVTGTDQGPRLSDSTGVPGWIHRHLGISGSVAAGAGVALGLLIGQLVTSDEPSNARQAATPVQETDAGTRLAPLPTTDYPFELYLNPSGRSSSAELGSSSMAASEVLVDPSTVDVHADIYGIELDPAFDAPVAPWGWEARGTGQVASASERAAEIPAIDIQVADQLAPPVFADEPVQPRSGPR